VSPTRLRQGAVGYDTLCSGSSCDPTRWKRTSLSAGLRWSPLIVQVNHECDTVRVAPGGSSGRVGLVVPLHGTLPALLSDILEM
jgi:hypothetical protein